MSHPQQTALATQALDLPVAERAQLALLLAESVQEENVDLWPDALVDELRRRSEDLKSGRVKGLTSEEVFGEPL